MAWFFGLMIVLVISALFFGRFARTESVRGYVSAVSGMSRLDARAPGIVATIDVRQGETVRRGQRLMQVKLREPTVGGVAPVCGNRHAAVLLEDKVSSKDGAVLVFAADMHDTFSTLYALRFTGELQSCRPSGPGGTP